MSGNTTQVGMDRRKDDSFMLRINIGGDAGEIAAVAARVLKGGMGPLHDEIHKVASIMFESDERQIWSEISREIGAEE